jgi:maleylpyruvate isomerase
VINVDLSDVEAATDRVISAVSGVDDELRDRPSRLPGWTVGNVLAHLALNAEAFVVVAAARRSGELGVMYPHGVDGRNRDIETVGAEPTAIILSRLSDSAEAFRNAWADPVPDGPCTPSLGRAEFSASSVLLRRLREVELHGVDVGHGLIEPADWSNAYVEADLQPHWDGIAERLPQGTGVVITDERGASWTAGSGNVVFAEMARSVLLAWIVDRASPESLPALDSWG